MGSNPRRWCLVQSQSLKVRYSRPFGAMRRRSGRDCDSVVEVESTARPWNCTRNPLALHVFVSSESCRRPTILLLLLRTWSFSQPLTHGGRLRDGIILDMTAREALLGLLRQGENTEGES